MTNQYTRPGSATVPVAVDNVVLITTPEGTSSASGSGGASTGAQGVHGTQGAQGATGATGIAGATLDTTDELTEGVTNKYFTVGRVAYTHTQGAASATWTINHNLSFYPNLTVQDSAGTIYEGEINYINSDSLTVTFSSAFSGKAYLS